MCDMLTQDIPQKSLVLKEDVWLAIFEYLENRAMQREVKWRSPLLSELGDQIWRFVPGLDVPQWLLDLQQAKTFSTCHSDYFNVPERFLSSLVNCAAMDRNEELREVATQIVHIMSQIVSFDCSRLGEEDSRILRNSFDTIWNLLARETDFDRLLHDLEKQVPLLAQTKRTILGY